MGKGADFERSTCRELSEWWSEGIGQAKSDDYFWRSSQSGGRATQRAKSGKRTFGSYGDITALNPLGIPLLDFFTIELKRGRSHGFPFDLIDAKPSNKIRPFEKCINQARRSAKDAKSKTWLLIIKPDRREAMCYLRGKWWMEISDDAYAPVTFFLPINPSLSPVVFVGVPLRQFLTVVEPRSIIRQLEKSLK